MPSDDTIFNDFDPTSFITRSGCCSRQINGTCSELPSSHCASWTYKNASATILTSRTSRNTTDYLEITLASPEHLSDPSVLFVFNATADSPGEAGLRVLLDGQERMPLVWDQKDDAGYEIKLDRGSHQVLRWEWFGLDSGSTGSATLKVSILIQVIDLHAR